MELFEPEAPDRTGGIATERIQRWLVDVGLADCDDPNAVILAESAMDLDHMNQGGYRLSHKDLVAARSKVGSTMAQARRQLQPLVDDQATRKLQERHRQHYSGVAARTLGWIDPAMLSPELRDLVAEHLAEAYDVELADYEPKEGAP